MKTNSIKRQSKNVETGIAVYRFRGNVITLQCSDADRLEEFLSCLAIIADDSFEYRRKYRNGVLSDVVQEWTQHLIASRDNITRL